jgi:hypothetical protein
LRDFYAAGSFSCPIPVVTLVVEAGDDRPAGEVTNPRHQPVPQRVSQPVKRDDDVKPPGYDGEQGAAVVEVVKVTGGDDDGTGRWNML